MKTKLLIIAVVLLLAALCALPAWWFAWCRCHQDRASMNMAVHRLGSLHDFPLKRPCRKNSWYLAVSWAFPIKTRDTRNWNAHPGLLPLPGKLVILSCIDQTFSKMTVLDAVSNSSWHQQRISSKQSTMIGNYYWQSQRRLVREKDANDFTPACQIRIAQSRTKSPTQSQELNHRQSQSGHHHCGSPSRHPQEHPAQGIAESNISWWTSWSNFEPKNPANQQGMPDWNLVDRNMKALA